MGQLNSKNELSDRKGGYSKEEVDNLAKFFSGLRKEGQDELDIRKLQEFLGCDFSECQACYNFFDMDGSGIVDSYKFICGMTMLRQLKLNSKAVQFFNVFDLGDKQSQLMTVKELRFFIQTMYTINANLKKEQQPSEDDIANLVDKLVKKYDSNHDERISLDEFQRLFSRDKNIFEGLRKLGILTTDDEQDYEELLEEDYDDEDLANELCLTNNEVDERATLIKEGITRDFNNNNKDDMFSEEQAKEGDQFTATKAWVGAVKASQPSDYKPKRGEGDQPNCSLELEYIHGYRCHDCRNNLKAGPNGELVYHTAAVGIVLDVESNRQKFFMEHTDDILCLDVCQTRVATGQIGHKPLIFVWDMTTLETIFVLKGVLEKGVVNICFSWDGALMAASGLDDEHHIIVYDVESAIEARRNPGKTANPGQLCNGKGPRSNILHLQFAVDNRTLVAACNKEMQFFEIDGKLHQLKSKRGLFGSHPLQPVMSVGLLNNQIVTGMFKGDIWSWGGNSVSKVFKAHEGSVNALHSKLDKKLLVSGGNDNLVKLWNSQYTNIATFDLAAVPNIKSLNLRVRSVYIDSQERLLVGTRGSEIVVFSSVNNSNSESKVVMRGHFDNELWGMCTDRKQNCFYTVGEDNLLAKWDIATRRQLLSDRINAPAKTIDISEDGSLLAVGSKRGDIWTFDPSTLKQLKNSAKVKHEISIVKFSPNSQLLAVGVAPPISQVFIYPAQNLNSKPKTCRGSPSRILHIDFSLDSRTFQLNNSSYEILYYKSDNGMQNTRGASENRDEVWTSWTCIIGWPVQGIWPPCSDGSDINTVDRDSRREVIATGDDFGKVKLFKYPCAKTNANAIPYGGHSAHVTQVRFNADNTYLISTGGGEKSIFVWKFNDQYVDPGEEAAADQSETEPDEVPPSQAQPQQGENDFFAEEEAGEGDQAGACKPYKGQCIPPSGWKPNKARDNRMPTGNLRLKHVYGYRCFDDCRNTAKFLANNKIVFVGAALGVVMNPETKEQTYFNQHIEDIVSMSVHPAKRVIATGQMAAKGKAKAIDLYVWDSETKEAICNLNEFHLRMIVQVAFSPSGTKLLSVGADDYQSFAVHDWQSRSMITNGRTDTGACTAVAWEDEKKFVTCGIKNIVFWEITGKTAQKKRGQVGRNSKFDPIRCCDYLGPNLITGTASGSVYVWSGNSAGKPVKAHEKCVSCIYVDKQTKTLYTGGDDGKILTWQLQGATLNQQQVVADISQVSQFNPEIRSIDFASNGDFLIGTRGSEIYIKREQSYIKVMEGHYEGEVWGCAANPDPSSVDFLSCGGDKTIRKWNAESKKMLGWVQLENDVRAVDWGQGFIIAGDVKGKIYLFDDNLQQLCDPFQSMFQPNPKKRGDPWIEDLKISPDQTTVIVGAHGGNFDLQAISCEGKLLRQKKKVKAALSSALTHVDWKIDSDVVMVNSLAWELMFLSVSAGNQTSASGQKDAEWATYTQVYGWAVQGIYPKLEGQDVCSTCRSNSKQLIAVADQFSHVSLFRFPCVVPKAQHKEYCGHSSYVTKVKFSADDSHLYSTGGNDKCVFVWETDFGAEGVQHQKAEEEESKKQLAGDQDDADNNYIEDDDCINPKVQRDKRQQVNQEEELGGNIIFADAPEKAGDEFMAIKPWLGAIKEPSTFQKNPHQAKVPNVDIELEYIHGYRAKDCRNNLFYLKSGKILYTAAAVGVVLDPQTNTQQFFNFHNDDITAIALGPDETKVATGELGPRPSIYVWDSTTMKGLIEFKNVIQKGIAALGFSPSGNLLAAAAIDDEHHICVLDVKNAVANSKKGGKRVTNHKGIRKYDAPSGAPIQISSGIVVKGGREIIRDLDWQSETTFTSVGVKHCTFWTLSETTLKGKKASPIPPKLILTCADFNCASTSKEVVCAGNDGHIYLASSGSLQKKTKEMIHYQVDQENNAKLAKSIDAVDVNKQYVVTGGKDGRINILNPKTYEVITSADLNTILTDSVCTAVRSICFDAKCTKLLIGTYGSEIYELKINGGVNANTTFALARKLMAGHYTPNKKWTNEAWGLAIFPETTNLYATCSDDGTFRIFDQTARKQILCHKTFDHTEDQGKIDPMTGDLSDSVKGRCIEINSTEQYAAIGFKDGTVRIYNIAACVKSQNEQELVCEKTWKCAKEWISDLKFSPDKKLLAIGSHDNAIYLYNVGTWTRKGIPLKKHSSYITHLDWSMNSCGLHSNCGAYELLFWDTESNKQEPSGASKFRDEEWATWTCVLGWPVQGIWEPSTDGTDINYVDRSHNPHKSGQYHLLALGDDFGKVRLLRYPSIQKNSDSIKARGHCSHVPCVKWKADDQYLYSIGGEDQCVFQWKVTQK